MDIIVSRPEGSAHVIVVCDGEEFELPASLAGSLGGYLIAAAHAPLQSPAQFTLTPAAPTPQEPVTEVGAAPPRVTPAMIARRAPVAGPVPAAPEVLYSSDPGSIDDRYTHDGQHQLTARAREQLDEAGFTDDDVREALMSPIRVGPAAYGDRLEYRNHSLRVLVPRDSPDVVIGIGVLHEMPSSPGRAKSGGPGRSIPSTPTELEGRLELHGFTVNRTRGSGHISITHPDHAGVIYGPSTPSDHRSYENLVAQIRRETGIDISST